MSDPNTTLPAAGLLLDGLIVLAVVTFALVALETALQLAVMRRERRERLAQTAKRSLALQSLAERSGGAGSMTLFRASPHKTSGASKTLALQPPVDAAAALAAVPALAATPASAAAATIITPAAALPEEARKPSGFERFKVLAVVEESPDVRSFRFAHAEGLPLAPFHPGQYLTIQITPADHGKPVIRCYSLSSAPHQSDFYQISVKAVGLVSKHLHAALKPGDHVELKKPAGKFYLDPAQRLDIALIAGGIGITPVYSMLREFLHHGRRNRIDLFYGCRSPDDVVYRKELEELAAKNPNFRLHIVLSRAPAEGGWKGLTGRVDIALIRRVLLYNLRGRAYYLCGPSQMMSDITDALVSHGVNPDDVHFEAFGPAAPKKAGEQPKG